MSTPDNLPPTQFTEKTRPTRAQRRRAVRRQRRKAVPSSVEARSEYIQALIQQAYPSYEFFLFAALSGAILGLGYLLDSQAILVFGILMAPLMSPLVGLTLATVSGTANYFLKALGAFLAGSILVAFTGALAGFAARLWLPLTLTQTYTNSRLWWEDLVVLAFGAILLAASFVRSEKKPFLPSVMVAYELFLPLSASSFGLASGISEIYPQGFLVFGAHLAWAMLFGALTLFFLGFRPHKFSGWIFSLLTVALMLVGLIWLFLPQANPESTSRSQPMPTSVAEVVGIPTDANVAEIPSSEILIPAATSTKTSIPTATLGLLPSPETPGEPSLTPTITPTPQPTPLYALIASSSGGGAFMRREPGGPVILTLENDELVQALTAPLTYDGISWVNVKVIRGTESFEGWIIQSVLKTATPSPGW